MRSFLHREPRRLGPFVVYEETTWLPQRHRLYGFRRDPWTPSQELVIEATPIAFCEPWSVVVDGVEHGWREGWRYAAIPAPSGVPLLEVLAHSELAASVRSALERVRPSLVSIDDVIVTWDGDVHLDRAHLDVVANASIHRTPQRALARSVAPLGLERTVLGAELRRIFPGGHAAAHTWDEERGAIIERPFGVEPSAFRGRWISIGGDDNNILVDARELELLHKDQADGVVELVFQSGGAFVDGVAAFFPVSSAFDEAAASARRNWSTPDGGTYFVTTEPRSKRFSRMIVARRALRGLPFAELAHEKGALTREERAAVAAVVCRALTLASTSRTTFSLAEVVVGFTGVASADGLDVKRSGPWPKSAPLDLDLASAMHDVRVSLDATDTDEQNEDATPIVASVMQRLFPARVACADGERRARETLPLTAYADQLRRALDTPDAGTIAPPSPSTLWNFPGDIELSDAQLAGLELQFARDPREYIGLVLAYAGRARVLEATVVCKKGIKSAPADVDVGRVILAFLHAKRGQTDEARALLLEVASRTSPGGFGSEPPLLASLRRQCPAFGELWHEVTAAQG